MAYNGTFALAAFTDSKEMLAESRRMAGSAESKWRMEERAIGCIPETAPAPTVLDVYDVRDLRGERLRTLPGTKRPDLSLVPRKETLTWNNATRSVDVCAYPYSVSSDAGFRGVTHFINFRCGFNPTAWGANTSSLVNWGTIPPEF